MEDTLELLAATRARDVPYERILGTMCTPPHPIAQKAYQMFIETNLGDPVLFPGARSLEDKALAWTGDLLHAPRTAAGLTTSGGTEGNITALLLSRHLSGKRDILIPEHAHFSLQKAARLLDMRLRPVDCAYRMTVDDVTAHLTDDTACVVAVAGSTPFGHIDEIAAIADVCADRGVFLHVDAAFGGFVAPFVSDTVFDFRVPVSTISLDAHKMGMACIPCGFLFARDGAQFDHLTVESRCTHTPVQTGFMGTRPGAAAAAAFAVMHALGRNGYRTVARRCMEVTAHCACRLHDAGIAYVEPELNIVAVKTETPRTIARALVRRNWYVGVDEKHGILRVVCMPHVTKDMINMFVTDLEEVLS
jgi:tyrosine decarboxylase/aspartate 1-decarboxylase